MTLAVTRGAVDAMLAAARRAHPLEACGLLLSRNGTIVEAAIADNLAQDPSRHFEVDPVTLIAAHKAERSGGPSLAGYWHSHPSGRAKPSATDQADASGDGRVWAIVAEGTIGWFRDAPGGFVALPTPEITG